MDDRAGSKEIIGGGLNLAWFGLQVRVSFGDRVVIDR